MKILNLHGYNGNPHNSAYGVLTALGHEVISPTLDYDKLTPEKLLSELCGLVEQSKVSAVVGISMGGFYASLLSVRLGLPAILINPCLMPFVYLPRLGSAGDIRPYMTLFAELSGIDTKKTSTVVGDCDEIIDTQELTKALLGSGRYVVVHGGMHSGMTLPLDTILPEFLESIIDKDKTEAARYGI